MIHWLTNVPHGMSSKTRSSNFGSDSSLRPSPANSALQGSLEPGGRHPRRTTINADPVI
jgi:hypothetical protein